MNRRGFLKSILAAGVAPYVVTASGVLMPVKKVVTLSEAALDEAVVYLHKEYGLIMTGNFSKALWPGVKNAWNKHFQECETIYAPLFKTGDTE